MQVASSGLLRTEHVDVYSSTIRTSTRLIWDRLVLVLCCTMIIYVLLVIREGGFPFGAPRVCLVLAKGFSRDGEPTLATSHARGYIVGGLGVV